MRVERSAVLPIEIYNPGATQLTISNIQRVTPEPVFLLDAPPAFPAVVPANGHLTVGLKFQPTTADELTCLFRIDSDDAAPGRSMVPIHEPTQAGESLE